MHTSVAWYLRDGDESRRIYRIQLDRISTKSEKKVLSSLLDWEKVGEMWYPDNELKGFIFQRRFATEGEFRAWSKSYPYVLKLLSSISDTIQKTKVGAIQKKGRGRPKGRRCGKCGGTNHNARTCKGSVAEKKIPKVTKKNRKHRKKCSICGVFDHNARTCPKRSK
jgi:hypothetical protein